SPTGPKNLVGIAFKDNEKKILRALVGLRENQNKQNTWIRFNKLDSAPFIAKNGKIHIKMWYNYQTLENVVFFGKDQLPLIMDQEIEITDNKIEIPVTIDEWDAVLIELSAP